VDSGEDALLSPTYKKCIHLKVVGKIYKVACFLNSREKAGTIDIASGML